MFWFLCMKTLQRTLPSSFPAVHLSVRPSVRVFGAALAVVSAADGNLEEGATVAGERFFLHVAVLMNSCLCRRVDESCRAQEWWDMSAQAVNVWKHTDVINR